MKTYIKKYLDLEIEGALRYVQPLPQKPPTYIRKEKKVHRNDLCPCGSGKKYKNCHILK